MPILKNPDGTNEIIKCKGYCLSSEKDKTCHETACRLNKDRKKTEFDIETRLEGQKVLDQVERNLY